MSQIARDSIEAAVILFTTAAVMIAVRIILSMIADKFDQRESNLCAVQFAQTLDHLLRLVQYHVSVFMRCAADQTLAIEYFY